MGWLAENDSQAKNQPVNASTTRQAAEGYMDPVAVQTQAIIKKVPGSQPTNIWARYAQAGLQEAKSLGTSLVDSTKAGFKGAATGIARSLPGGQNDLKAEAQGVDDANKNTSQIIALHKSGKITSAQASKLLSLQATNASQESAAVAKTVKSEPTTKQFAGDVAQVALLLAPFAGKTSEVTGEMLLKQFGTQGVKNIADRAGVDIAGKGAIEGAQQVAKSKLASQAFKKASTDVISRGAKASVKSAAGFGGFSAAQTAGEGGSNKEILKSGGKGAAAGAVLGLGGSFLASAYKALRVPYIEKANIPAGTEKSPVTKLGQNIRPQGPKELGPGTMKALPEGKPAGESKPLEGNATQTKQQVDQAKIDELNSSHDKKVNQLITDFNQVTKSLQKNEHTVSKTPVHGYTSTRQLQEDHAAQLKSIESDARGGDMIPNGEGGYKRTNSHSAFYRNTYADKGRAPTKQEYMDQALKEMKAGNGVTDKTYDQIRQQALKDTNDKYEAKLAEIEKEHEANLKEVSKPKETGFTISSQAKKATGGSKRESMVAQMDERLQKVEAGKIIIGKQARKDLFNARHAIDSGENDHLIGKDVKETVSNFKHNDTRAPTSEPLEPKPKTAPAQAAEAPEPKGPSLSVKVSKPKAPPPEEEPLVNNNKEVKSLVNRFTPKKFKGKLNPVDAVARQGHTTFADNIRSIAQRKIYALRKGNLIANDFDKAYADYLVKGGTHQQFIKDIESGNISSKAHQLWEEIHSVTGEQMADLGITKGARNNYVGRVAQFDKRSFKQGGTGLSKSGSFSKKRATVNDEFGISHDKYVSHEEFKKAVESQGAKVLSDPRDILRHTIPSKLEAIENAKGLLKLDKTPMADGRPASVTYDINKGLPGEYGDYDKNLLQGRAVHPEASSSVKALTHTYTTSEINNPVAKANSVAKQLITLNGLVHAKNFGLASLRKQGVIRTVAATLKSNKDLADTFGEKNIERAIVKGGVVPFEQNKQDMFDTLSNPKSSKSLSNAASFPGKAVGKERDLLFNKLGNHLQFSTYFNAEKQMLKAGLSEDEAARVAGQAAKNVSFISSPVETSVEYRKSARFIFFAGQYFKSTLNEMAKAIGTSRDASLSSAAQRQVQKNAITGIARGATYLFALAQGINYHATGHFTWQNKDSKISPVFYVDKTSGKQYHITNWYGQIGDMMHLFGNPVKETMNKVSPMFQEGARLYAGAQGAVDPYTGQTVIDKNAPGWRQTAQAAGNILEYTMTPAGFGISNTHFSSPGSVNIAKLFGYGASTSDYSPVEKEVLNKWYATFPAGASQTPLAMSTLETAARNDIAKGNKNSANVQQLQKTMTPTAFKAFMKTGGDTMPQRAWSKLSTEDKLQLIEKYSPSQLKEFDLTDVAKTLTGSSAKSVVTSLQTKGYTPERIQKDLQKVGIDRGQLQQIKAEAKRQAAISAREARRQPKFVNPLLK